jgi:putative membrane protein
MMYGWAGGWGVGVWVLMGAMMTVLWCSLIAMVVILVRGARRAHSGRWELGAEDILRDRFARGEIDREEYESRLAALRQNG